MLSLYEMSEPDKRIVERTVRTEFRPFAVNGEIENDSVTIAAAYRIHSDSIYDTAGTIGISYFNSLKEEFIEHDYEINEKANYVTSALAIHPDTFFF